MSLALQDVTVRNSICPEANPSRHRCCSSSISGSKSILLATRTVSGSNPSSFPATRAAIGDGDATTIDSVFAVPGSIEGEIDPWASMSPRIGTLAVASVTSSAAAGKPKTSAMRVSQSSYTVILPVSSR